MNQLVFIENQQVVTDSLTIAEVFGKDKEHFNVTNDIKISLFARATLRSRPVKPVVGIEVIKQPMQYDLVTKKSKGARFLVLF